MIKNLLKKFGLIIASLLLILGLGADATSISSNNIVNASHHYRHSRRYHKRKHRRWDGIYHKYTHRHHVYLAGNCLQYRYFKHEHKLSHTVTDYHDLCIPDHNYGMKMKMVSLFNLAHKDYNSYKEYRKDMKLQRKDLNLLNKRDIRYENHLWKISGRK